MNCTRSPRRRRAPTANCRGSGCSRSPARSAAGSAAAAASASRSRPRRQEDVAPRSRPSAWPTASASSRAATPCHAASHSPTCSCTRRTSSAWRRRLSGVRRCAGRRGRGAERRHALRRDYLDVLGRDPGGNRPASDAAYRDFDGYPTVRAVADKLIPPLPSLPPTPTPPLPPPPPPPTAGHSTGTLDRDSHRGTVNGTVPAETASFCVRSS